MLYRHKNYKINLSDNFWFTSILCFIDFSAKFISVKSSAKSYKKDQNRNAHTGFFFFQNVKFSGKVALKNCILTILPNILSDWFDLSFESYTYNTRWTNKSCIYVRSLCTKSYRRYPVTINVIYIWKFWTSKPGKRIQLKNLIINYFLSRQI